MSKNHTSSSTTTDQWYELYGDSYQQDGCHVSNDPPSTNSRAEGNKRSLVSLKTCNITQYMCILSEDPSQENNVSNTTNTVEAIEVLYEYEIYFNSEINLTTSLVPYIEESMLETLATNMGIAQCIRRRGARTRRRHRKEQSINGNSSDVSWQKRFVGINVHPRDVANMKYTMCKAIPSMSMHVGDEMECIPMIGGVTVYVQLTTEEMASFTSEDRQAIRGTVSRFIKDAMDADAFVVPTSIEKVVFVGNSSNPVATPISTDSDIQYSSSSVSLGWIIALTCVVLSFMILLICCFCNRKRRRTQTSQLVNGSSAGRSNNESALCEDHDPESGMGGPGAPRCLASLDSLALRGENGTETLSKIVESDNESDSNTIPTSSVESNSMIKEDPKENSLDDHSCGNDEHSQEHGGQNAMELIEEEDEVESLVAAMSDEFDLLDRLVLQGHIPPYPSPTNQLRDDLLNLTPTRSLSPTTISAASQSTMYTGSRKIVGSPTTCSQTTMRAGNLRYISKNRKTSLATISTGYTPPDSFEAEILGVTSDDSQDHMYQHKDYSEPPSHPRTFADVLDGHDPYIINEEDLSYRSENENTSVVQRRLQMS